MPTTNPLKELPNEILKEIVELLRVNDQICLALTAKRFNSIITSDKTLACNSTDPDVRFEAWRFHWLNTGANSPRPNCGMNLDNKKRKKEHLRRCIKSNKVDLRGRLNLNVRKVPLQGVYATPNRRLSVRRASMEATARIHKIYLGKARRARNIDS